MRQYHPRYPHEGSKSDIFRVWSYLKVTFGECDIVRERKMNVKLCLMFLTLRIGGLPKGCLHSITSYSALWLYFCPNHVNPRHVSNVFCYFVVIYVFCDIAKRFSMSISLVPYFGLLKIYHNYSSWIRIRCEPLHFIKIKYVNR